MHNASPSRSLFLNTVEDETLVNYEEVPSFRIRVFRLGLAQRAQGLGVIPASSCRLHYCSEVLPRLYVAVHYYYCAA